MTPLECMLQDLSDTPIRLLDPAIQLEKYTPISLSVHNAELGQYDVCDPLQCQRYVANITKQAGALVAYGGYLEKRALYERSPNFLDNSLHGRNIHLGMDFWAKAGTTVHSPLAGRVHSFGNNRGMGNYGPTIILNHNINDMVFYTLYGHLSIESIEDLEVGSPIEKGSLIGSLGTAEVNGDYAPHLHFQIITDVEGHAGDYPGVCSAPMLKHYSQNCPYPNILLKMGLTSIG